MLFFSALSLAALVGTANAAAVLKARDYISPAFKLVSSSSNATYDGKYLVPFHTGAGLNAAVLLPSALFAPDFQFASETGDVFYENVQINVPFSIGFSGEEPYNSTAPAGYDVVTINAGFPESGLSFNGTTLVVPAAYGTFAACYVNGIAPYFGVGPQYQVLYGEGDVPEGSDCANITFNAVPVDA